MDWTNAGQCALWILAIFGVVCVISIRYARKFNRDVKAAVEQPKPKEGRVVLREVVEGMSGMPDSYIAEIRDHGDGDIRLHIYNVAGQRVMEAPVNKCYELGLMMAGERIERTTDKT